MIIFTTDAQQIAEDLIYNTNKTEEEIEAVIEGIYNDLELGMIPGATLIGTSIVSDNIVAATFLNEYGFNMEQKDLHRLCA